MKAPDQQLTMDAVFGGATRRAAEAPAQSRTLSYPAALWIARLGRVAAIWLPLWAVCLAQLPTPQRALAASAVLALVWKLALRRSYSDVVMNVWTMGALAPAAVGAITGALVVLPLTLLVPSLHLTVTALTELTLAVLIASAVWETTVASSVAARRSILVVGGAGCGVDLLQDVRLAPRLPFDVVGVVDDHEIDRVAGVRRLGSIGDLPRIVEEQRPQLVVLADEACRDAALEELIEVGHLDFSVVGLAEFYEHAFGRLPVPSLTPQWFMSLLHLYRRPYSRLAKRTFDIVVSSVALVLVAPLLPVLALLVRLTPGPVILRQTRLGEGGKPFTLFKFRTMRVDAEPAGAVWACERDPRVTTIGRFMRKTRLDELPQLWNALRGDMSVVGPRPERPEFVATLEAKAPFWRRRHLVKPGITGWAQVCRGYTANAAGTRDKLSYDLWYLRHRSLVVDLAICARTFCILLTGSGAR
jgi:exopolysaccharide biosynthesis polyprenyl glycosylphosphotransferase